MQNVQSAIKWSVCITMKLVGDIYSRTPTHTRGPYTKGPVIARTISQRSSVLVRAFQRGSIPARMKSSISDRRSPLNSRAYECFLLRYRPNTSCYGCPLDPRKRASSKVKSDMREAQPAAGLLFERPGWVRNARANA